MAEEPAPVALEEAPSIIEEVAEAAAEVVVQGADIVEEVAEVVEQAADKVVEVAATATEVAEEVKAVAVKIIEAAEEVKESIADEAPAATPLALASPTPELVEVAKGVAPAKYADLGKEARDLICKDIHTVQKVKLTTKSSNGFQMITEGSHNTASGVVAASVETKMNCADCGVSLLTKWNTDSIILNTLSTTNKGLNGLNVDIDTSYSLVSGKKTMKVSTAYTGSSLFHPTLDLDVVDITKPNVDFSLVLAHQGLHAGYQTSFDSGSKSLLGHNVSVGYKADKFVLHGVVENASKFIGSVFYKIKEGLSAAAQVEYSSGATPNITVCGKYDIDEISSYKARVDQNFLLSCSYMQKIRAGLTFTISTVLNGKDLSGGGHKMGLSLDFQA